MPIGRETLLYRHNERLKWSSLLIKNFDLASPSTMSAKDLPQDKEVYILITIARTSITHNLTLTLIIQQIFIKKH